jgi:AcrR family transcriptional regulator
MRRKKEDAQKTYDNILDASAMLFAEKGLSSTSLEDIAKAANVTRGAIYWHFKNKGEIFNSLHQRLYQPLSDVILQDLCTDDNNPLQQLSDLCIKLLLELSRDPIRQQTMMLFMLRCNYTGAFAEYKDVHSVKKEESLRLFSRYFEKAKEEGNLPESADPALLTIAVRCYMKGIITEYLQEPQTINLEESAEKLIIQFFKQFN